MKEPKIKTMKQSDLTSDCWLVQMWGLDSCKDCEVRGTDECGGGESLKRLQKGAQNDE